MIFAIDSDHGSAVSGWLAPDNPTATPRLIVEWGAGESVVIDATVVRQDVQALGVHSTGLVGFYLDESIVPGLANLYDLALRDADTRALIYRRFQPDSHIERKFFLFDTAVMPQRNLHQALLRRFALPYFNAEKYSFETMLVLINNQSASSIVMSGRANFLRYSHYLENNGFKTAALLRDPYEELAERLLFFNLLSRSKAAHLLPQFGSGIELLSDFARTLQFDDPKALVAAFRDSTPDQRRAMANPMCRIYGCLPEEEPQRIHVSTALENLSRMDVVGIRPRWTDFQSMVAAMLEYDVFEGAQFVDVAGLGAAREALAGTSLATDLLEHDLALYSWAEEAVSVGLDSDGEVEQQRRDNSV